MENDDESREVDESIAIANAQCFMAARKLNVFCISLEQAEIATQIFGLKLANASDIFAHH